MAMWILLDGPKIITPIPNHFPFVNDSKVLKPAPRNSPASSQSTPVRDYKENRLDL